MRALANHPLEKGVARVPQVMQMESLECGAAALAMVLAYYGKWMPLEQVRIDCGVSRDGASLENIAKAARSYGLQVEGYQRGVDALRQQGPYPCIITYDAGYVVCCGFSGDRVHVNDPAKGSRKIAIDEFARYYGGICLTFAPTDDFVPGGKRKSTLEFARNRLSGAGVAVAFVAVTTLVAYLFEMLTPAFTRFFMDRLLTGENSDLLMPFIALLSAVAVLQVVVVAVKSVYSLKINGKMAVIGSSTFMWQVLRMPMEFFSQRQAGDIQQRKNTNAVIAETLVNTFTPLALNIAMMAFYLVVMIRYSALLTLVGIAAIVMNSLLASFISRKRVNITRVQMRDAGKLSSSTVSGIQMIETIKASGAENGYFAKWAGYQASVNAATTRFANLNLYLGMVPNFLTSLANYAVLIIGVFLVMQGQFSLGMVMAFQGYISLFMNPAMMTVKAGQVIQEMRTQMERVEDVMEYPIDPNYRDEPLADEADYGKLEGKVELRNVTFGYGRSGGRGFLDEGGAGRKRGARRHVRLRQVHALEADRGLVPAVERRDPVRRHAGLGHRPQRVHRLGGRGRPRHHPVRGHGFQQHSHVGRVHRRLRGYPCRPRCADSRRHHGARGRLRGRDIRRWARFVRRAATAPRDRPRAGGRPERHHHGRGDERARCQNRA